MADKPFIGQMDRVIQVVKFEADRNSTGEKETTQIVVANPYARMEDISGGEDVEGKIRYLVNRRYTIRFNTEINTLKNKLGVLDEGKMYNVVNVVPIGKTHLQLIVKVYE